MRIQVLSYKNYYITCNNTRDTAGGSRGYKSWGVHVWFVKQKQLSNRYMYRYIFLLHFSLAASTYCIYLYFVIVAKDVYLRILFIFARFSLFCQGELIHSKYTVLPCNQNMQSCLCYFRSITLYSCCKIQVKRYWGLVPQTNQMQIIAN